MGETRLFLRLDGIPGDATDERHADEIELMAFSWGLAASGAGGGFGGGAGTGKVEVDGLTAAARTSRASPLMMLACAEGRHLKDALLTVQQAGERPVDIVTLRLSDVTVAAYSVGAGGGDGPEDEVALTFRQIQFEVSDGQKQTSAGWDVARNAPV